MSSFELMMVSGGRPQPAYPSTAEWLMADHLRIEHDFTMAEIVKRTGLPYREIRQRYSAKS